ncbi:MAG: hypothetical protein KBA40_01220 [Candidatus Peribacteraceae bacterium]|nr:hypothetical protein [Candidatus Peribacteraceae bacterium]MBP9850535.1 hypothetical protein [Candidatus Peribacteraceae bacterium]
MKTPLKFLTLSAAILTISLLGACTRDEGPGIAYGPTSATGTLIQAENSLIRRGSHILVVDGEKKYFVESRTQNMSDLEGQTVFIDGTLEQNSVKTELPVLVATTVKRSFGDEDLHRFEIPTLNIRLGVPQTWAGSIKNKVATFMLPGESLPILTIRLMSGSTLPPGGTAIFVKNRRGTRIDAQGNAADVFILEKDSVIELHFDPATQEQLKTEEDGAIVASQFERAISTISFLTDKDVTTPTSGSGAGTLCGGAAGILCGAGYFCNITDIEHQIGQCKERR